MIFVPAESTYGGIPSTSGVKDLANPYLAGFGFSRPKARIPKECGTIHDVGKGQEISNAPGAITLDWYHHPNKRLHPELSYLQAFDLYSYVQCPLLNLGVLTHQRYLQ